MRAVPLTGGVAFSPSGHKGALLGAAVVANVAVVGSLVSDRAAAAVLLALLPALVLGIGALMSGHRAMLAYAALALNFTNFHYVTDPLPLFGGVGLFATDVILLLAIGAWIAERLTRREETDGRRAGALAVTWPLMGLAVITVFAVLRGHERYGIPLFGQPLRLIIYAGIAVALIGVDARSVWRGITAVFYAGAVLQSYFAVHDLATGGSQTTSLSLSTGGTRVIALSTATYLVGSLVCALLNLERERHRPGRQVLHALIAGLALFAILASYGRTTYAAVAVIIPALLVMRRSLRRAVFWLLPLLLPLIVVIALIAPNLYPTLLPTFTSRVKASPGTDINVIWRDRAREVSLEGVDDSLLTGIGFGRPARFMLQGQLQDVTGDPHNSYVYLLAGGGLIALGSLLVVMLAYAVDVVRRYRRAVDIERTLLVWSLCTWFAFMTNAFYGPVLSDALMLMTIWILMTLPQCVLLRRGDDSAPDESARPSP